MASPVEEIASRTRDFSTLSNAYEISASHLHLDWSVDFASKEISGSATYRIDAEKLAGYSGDFVLDTRDLNILAVTDGSGKNLPFKLEAATEKADVFGNALRIGGIAEAASKLAGSSSLTVQINYKTSPGSTACQWVQPESTAGRKHPYLFTQCQAIHARSLLPCQDCPAAKFTYSARVECPSWATALMSAIAFKDKEMASQDRHVFHYEQKVPIPSYLVALVVGNVTSRTISSRVAVWSEPEEIEKVEYEFAETEEFLNIAEEITGLPYQWGRYDVLCLPPSFPYGGMENPCLTFVTPTLLAGDRSLADVVAHEIAHSWTGNVVTNHTWEHFWLNEGWTVWLERRIKQEINKKRSEASNAKKETGSPRPKKFCSAFTAGRNSHCIACAVGFGHLIHAVDGFKEAAVPEYSRLLPNLEGVDPDDVFSAVPYEKGCGLILTLELLLDGELCKEDGKFTTFVRNYIERFKFKTITSQKFKQFAIDQFKELQGLDLANAIDWDSWFVADGIFPQKDVDRLQAATRSPLISEAEALAAEWARIGQNPATAKDLAARSKNSWVSWGTELKLIFLEAILHPNNLDIIATEWLIDTLRAFDEAHGLKSTKNCEVLFLWYKFLLSVAAKEIAASQKFYVNYEADIVSMLTSQGRMKYTRPLYMAYNKVDPENARKVFQAHADFYHPICRLLVSKDLKLK